MSSHLIPVFEKETKEVAIMFSKKLKYLLIDVSGPVIGST